MTERKRPPEIDPPEIEMSLDGSFIAPSQAPLSLKIGLGAVVAAVVLGGLALAALALWLAFLLVPLAILAAVIAWGALRFRLWRAGRASGGAGH